MTQEMLSECAFCMVTNFSIAYQNAAGTYGMGNGGGATNSSKYSA
jgi:hypothetical protein